MPNYAEVESQDHVKGATRSGELLWRSDQFPPDLLCDRRYGARHEELLEGIETIILTEGFCDLTIGELAGRLRCSQRTLQEIAESKETMVLVVIDRLFRRLASRVNEAMRAEVTGLDELYTYLTYGLVELRQATLDFTDDLADAPAVRELMAAHFRYAVGQVKLMLAAGIEAGEFAPFNPTLAAEMLDAGILRILDSESAPLRRGQSQRWAGGVLQSSSSMLCVFHRFPNLHMSSHSLLSTTRSDDAL